MSGAQQSDQKAITVRTATFSDQVQVAGRQLSVAAQLGHNGLGQIKRYVGVGNDVRQAACATVEL